MGKTDLSIYLAKRLNGEVISADSVQVPYTRTRARTYTCIYAGCNVLQVYRYMDIGSAKVTKDIQAAVPHHLLDVIDISQNFSAGDYYQRATAAVQVSVKIVKVILN